MKFGDALPLSHSCRHQSDKFFEELAIGGDIRLRGQWKASLRLRLVLKQDRSSLSLRRCKGEAARFLSRRLASLVRAGRVLELMDDRRKFVGGCLKSLVRLVPFFL